MFGFEMGPIRPPSEAYSILLRITRNCPWNKCVFCGTYKDQKFSIRDVEEIKDDIDSMYFITSKIIEKVNEKGSGQFINQDMINEIITEDSIPENFLQQILFWLNYGMKSAFLQDADSLVMKTDKICEILDYFRERFPTVERITSYARAKTISSKPVEELKKIRSSGLNRLHIGMETGSDKVLELVRKGVTAEKQIVAGQNAVEAGFELSEYFMPGLGGAELTRENAIETARVINEINPTFVRFRTTTAPPGTPLFELMVEDKWTPLSEEEKVKEIRLFIENLDGITSNILSDHMMNLIEDVEGKLPGDKKKILGILDRFLDMSIDDKESFIVGRRLGHFRYLADYSHNPEVEKIKNRLKDRYSSIDEAVRQVVKNYL